MCMHTGKGCYFRNNRIIPSDFRILLLLEMPIPNIFVIIIVIYYSFFYLHFTSVIACFLLINLELQTKYCWLCDKLLVLFLDSSVVMAGCTQQSWSEPTVRQWRTVGFQSVPSVSNCKLHIHILHISVTANTAICIMHILCRTQALNNNDG